MTISQSIASTTQAGRGGGSQTGAAPTRSEAPAKVRTASVSITLTPEARQHLSRLEGFAATIGTDKQHKTYTKPGSNLDLRT